MSRFVTEMVTRGHRRIQCHPGPYASFRILPGSGYQAGVDASLSMPRPLRAWAQRSSPWLSHHRARIFGWMEKAPGSHAVGLIFARQTGISKNFVDDPWTLGQHRRT